MRLPSKNDPHGDREGSQTRQRVLDILYENSVSVIHEGGGVIILEKGDVSIAQSLPPVIPGRMISYLARTFDIPVTDFHFKPIPGLH